MKRDKLKEFREKQHLTQENMAKTLDITVAHYKSIEYGYRNPSFDLLKKMKNIFPNLTVDKIFLLQKYTLSKKKEVFKKI